MRILLYGLSESLMQFVYDDEDDIEYLHHPNGI